MLRYIVSHLRERALTNGWQYISATIFDGLNNLKEKKTPIFGVEKRLRQKKPSGSRFFYHEFANLRIVLLEWRKNTNLTTRIGFLFNTNYHVIDHEFFMNYFLEHESLESARIVFI